VVARIGAVNDDENWERFESGLDASEPRNVEDDILRSVGSSLEGGRGKLGGHYSENPYTQWGKSIAATPPVGGGPSVAHVREFFYLELPEPTSLSLRLSATADTAPVAGWFVTWTVLIGLGASVNKRLWRINVTNTIGLPSDDTLVAPLPVQVLRISGIVTQTGGGGRTTMCAQAAPYFPQGAGHDTQLHYLRRIATLLER
jgi:hypothetical protein